MDEGGTRAVFTSMDESGTSMDEEVHRASCERSASCGSPEAALSQEAMSMELLLQGWRCFSPMADSFRAGFGDECFAF